MSGMLEHTITAINKSMNSTKKDYYVLIKLRIIPQFAYVVVETAIIFITGCGGWGEPPHLRTAYSVH